jgi:hypothetical protein
MSVSKTSIRLSLVVATSITCGTPAVAQQEHSKSVIYRPETKLPVNVGRGPTIFSRATFSPPTNVSGLWSDDAYSVGDHYLWTLNQDQSGNITGSLNTRSCSVPTWPVSGTRFGGDFVIKATNPTGGSDPCTILWFQYTLDSIGCPCPPDVTYYGTSLYSNGDTGFAGITPLINVLSPFQNQTFPAGGSNYNTTDPIAFNGTTIWFGGTPVFWTVNLTYMTSGGRCVGCTNSQVFETESGSNGTEVYVSMGGQLVTTAAANTSDMMNMTSYIVGAEIPTETEVSLLDSIYPGPTSNLLSGIAYVESSIAQFEESSNYGISAYWPKESNDGGSHIGLLQLPVAMDVAWDYTINVQKGEQLFAGEKVGFATRLMNKDIATHTGLPVLNGVQLENMALLLYGPKASTKLAMQYYVPFCQGGTVIGNTCSGGSWVWIVNTAGNPKGVAYANLCRNHVQ